MVIFQALIEKNTISKEAIYCKDEDKKTMLKQVLCISDLKGSTSNVSQLLA